jgi:predicted Zn-dependent protease
LSDAAETFRQDAEDAVRIVSGLLRRGEGGEAFRERRRRVTWTANEAGLLAPAFAEERGTAVRLRRGRESLLVARDGDGPEALREAVREASRRGGGSPFLKSRGLERVGAEIEVPRGDEEERAVQLGAALHRALPDPRGLSLALRVARVTVSRVVVTARQLVTCGTVRRLEAAGVLRRGHAARPFAFQTSAPWAPALDMFGRALADAARPVPAHRVTEGSVNVVFSQGAASVFWHEAVGHPLEAGGGERGSVLTRVPRAAVAPPGVFVTSDPTRGDLPGHYLADDEGTPASPAALLTDGCVDGQVTDRRTAGGASNGHARCGDFRRPPRPRLSNLVVSPGRASREDLLAACGNGLYVREISAGHADPESGRFTLFVESADLVRKGALGAPLGPFVLTSDVLTALRNLHAESGDATHPASGLGLCVKGGEGVAVGGASPAILIRGLTAVRGRP